MLKLKLNEQLTFLRKQKEITQEELAQVLGVTNQTVSKWESASCCPDIQLLPEIASFYEVSIDELLGYKPVNTCADLYLQIKDLFKASSKEEAFSIAYRLGCLLHEGACTRGYREYVPWNTDKEFPQEGQDYPWGTSICAEPEGVTVRKVNSVFISDNQYHQTLNQLQLNEIHSLLTVLSDSDTFQVLFELYKLTAYDYDLYIPPSTLEKNCQLPPEAVLAALHNLPCQCKKDSKGQIQYRIEGSFMHVPVLLSVLTFK